MLRILKAYANFDKEIGYTQGMNYIVAALIYCLNPNNDKTSLQGFKFIKKLLSFMRSFFSKI